MLKRLDEALGLAVGPGPVGPGAQVSESELATGLGVNARAIAGAVVAHDSLERDPAMRTMRRPPQKAGGGLAALVGEHLDVGQAGGVVDANVDDSQPIRRSRERGEAITAVAGDAMARPRIRPSFLTSTWTSSPGRFRS